MPRYLLGDRGQINAYVPSRQALSMTMMKVQTALTIRANASPSLRAYEMKTLGFGAIG